MLQPTLINHIRLMYNASAAYRLKRALCMFRFRMTSGFSLLRVHFTISAFKHILHADIVRRLKNGDAARNCDMFLRTVFPNCLMQRLHQRLTILIIRALQYHDKFIAADAVNRTVREYRAEHFARVTDICISGDMSFCIIDLFQPVDIADDNGEFRRIL